jgi:hypothetical protein
VAPGDSPCVAKGMFYQVPEVSTVGKWRCSVEVAVQVWKVLEGSRSRRF